LKGYFITLEGIEGSGKTSQVAAITDKLKEMGYDPIVTREPGGCRLAEKIRAILLDPENTNLVPMAELFLYLAHRAQHVKEVIVPALEQGKVVVCDRFVDATIAYQGYARRLGPFRVS
jgi:dTMP kinase